MRYISTRDCSESGAERKSFCDILLTGLAKDGGLYVPETYPTLSKLEIRKLQGYSYQDLALYVLELFCDDIPRAVLKEIIAKSYNEEIFGSEQVTPLRRLDREISLLQLSNGPTLAFKDLALQPLAHLMEYVLERENAELNILGATSGDTGSAAAYAVRGKKRLRLFMLSPYGRMSHFQARQMYTLDEPNIVNVAVNGNFDDCQTIVKAINAEAAFKDEYRLGAVNSINWARIALQVVYYIYAYLQVAENDFDEVTFAVPSGNFGNALAAYIATQMGLPISVIVCTNQNDVLDEFFRTGLYRIRSGEDVAVTSSPSMDIASASNFERFMFDYVDRDPFTMRRFLQTLNDRGEFNVLESDPGEFFRISSGMATDEEVLETIRQIHRSSGIIIDPHTAVAMKVGLEKYRANGGKLVVAETAQPAKFADTIKEALGFEPLVPQGYKDLDSLAERVIRIDPSVEAVKGIITDHLAFA